MINKANCAGKRYLKIAPITGVVQPINNNKEIANINRLIIKPCSSLLIFLLFLIEKSTINDRIQTSNMAGNRKELPGSLGNGLA